MMAPSCLTVTSYVPNELGGFHGCVDGYQVGNNDNKVASSVGNYIVQTLARDIAAESVRADILHTAVGGAGHNSARQQDEEMPLTIYKGVW